MESKVPVARATMEEAVLPQRVREALGQLVSAAREGLLAVSVRVGLGVLTELLKEEVDQLVGSQGKHDTERAAIRHCHEGDPRRSWPSSRSSPFRANHGSLQEPRG